MSRPSGKAEISPQQMIHTEEDMGQVRNPSLVSYPGAGGGGEGLCLDNNGSLMLICLNTWSLVGGIVWEGL